MHAGCGTLWSLDGNWKLSYPVCMFKVARYGQAFQGKLKYVSSCSREPIHGLAFCEEHCADADKLNIPKTLRGYIKHCKERKQSCDGSTPSNQQSTEEISAADCQG